MKQNTKTLIFTLFLLISVTLGSAQSFWNDPTISAPGKEIDVPINTTSSGQYKTGTLVTSGIFNEIGAYITYPDLIVGNEGSDYSPGTSDDFDAPAYFFGNLFIKKAVRGSDDENILCVDVYGRVKVCNGVEFGYVEPTYSTGTNVTSWPTSPNYVTGYVKYKIPSGISCNKVATANTDWQSGSISGENSNYPVRFYDWGDYELKMNCDGIDYSVNIHIGGLVIDSTAGYTISHTLDLGSSRSAYVYVTGGGGSAANEINSCLTGFNGGNSSVKIGSTSIMVANGGGGAEAGQSRSCGKIGTGGTASINQSSSQKISKDGQNGYVAYVPPTRGATPITALGGCSGAPDYNGSFYTCNASSLNLNYPYGQGGVGEGDGSYGGGGGSHVSGYYTLPATGDLHTFVGAGGGKGSSSGTPKGSDGFISIVW